MRLDSRSGVFIILAVTFARAFEDIANLWTSFTVGAVAVPVVVFVPDGLGGLLARATARPESRA